MRTTATLLALLLLASCKAEGVAGLGSKAAAGGASERAAVSSGAAAVSSDAAAERMVVRTATMHIVVADTAKAVGEVTASVESFGGYVTGSQVWREGDLLRARLTVRVPSEKLTPALAAIRRAARRVENETLASEDVTRQYVDLGSQLRNLEATENELRELLVTVRRNARRAEDILEVHRQLVAIRGEIEVTKGRMQHLAASSATSQIALEITPDAITRPVAEGEWQPVVVMKEASRALLVALRGVVAAAIWIVICVVPLAGIVVLVAAGLASVTRRLRRRPA